MTGFRFARFLACVSGAAIVGSVVLALYDAGIPAFLIFCVGVSYAWFAHLEADSVRSLRESRRRL